MAPNPAASSARAATVPPIAVVGLSHRSAPASLRDRVCGHDGEVPALLDRLRGIASEVVVLATCDRVEAYCAGADPVRSADRIEAAFRTALDAAGPAARTAAAAPGIERRFGLEALRHLFRVTASLDSVVIGEPQILGQIRAAEQAGRAAGTVGPVLSAAFAAALAAARRVRAETRIGERPVTLAAAAIHVARGVHGDLSGVGALVLGAGELAELFTGQLVEAGIGRIAVTASNAARAEAMAHRHRANTVAFPPDAATLARADIVVATVGAGPVLLDRTQMQAALRARRRRPVFVLDAATPRDVAADVAGLDGVFVYDLADLERVALDGRAGRQAATPAAEALVSGELERYLVRQRQRQAVPALRALQADVEAERQAAIATAGGDADRATRLLTRRLLHRPMVRLKALAATDPAAAAEAARWLGRLFARDPKEDQE